MTHAGGAWCGGDAGDLTPCADPDALVPAAGRRPAAQAPDRSLDHLTAHSAPGSRPLAEHGFPSINDDDATRGAGSHYSGRTRRGAP